MEKRKLGNSDLEITPIGLGAWAIGGGGWEFGWGPQEDQDSIAAIHEGFDRGINWIDTAPLYGDGASEEAIGRHLAVLSPRPHVSTKVRLDRPDMVDIAGAIRRSLEQSLKRLQLDRGESRSLDHHGYRVLGVGDENGFGAPGADVGDLSDHALVVEEGLSLEYAVHGATVDEHALAQAVDLDIHDLRRLGSGGIGLERAL